MTKKSRFRRRRVFLSVALLVPLTISEPSETNADEIQEALPPAMRRVQESLDALSEWSSSSETIRVRWDQVNKYLPSAIVTAESQPLWTVAHDLQAVRTDKLFTIDVVTITEKGVADGEEVHGFVAVEGVGETTVVEKSFMQSAEMTFVGSAWNGGNSDVQYAVSQSETLTPMEHPLNFLLGNFPSFARPREAIQNSNYAHSGWEVVEEVNKVMYKHDMTDESAEFVFAPSKILDADLLVSMTYVLPNAVRIEKVFEELDDGFRVTITHHEYGLKSLEILATFRTDSAEQRSIRYSSIPEPDTLPIGTLVRIVDSGLSYRVGQDKVSAPQNQSLKEIRDAIH